MAEVDPITCFNCFATPEGKLSVSPIFSKRTLFLFSVSASEFKVDISNCINAFTSALGLFQFSVEKAYKIKHPDCIYCGAGSGQKVGIQIHHIHPFHQVVGVGRNDLELDPRNLTSLCETEKNKPAPDHHIACGHLGSFQRNNEKVLEDVILYSGKDQHLIEGMVEWKTEESSAPKPFSAWTEQEKKDYRAKLDKELPPDPTIIKQFFPNGLPISHYTS